MVYAGRARSVVWHAHSTARPTVLPRNFSFIPTLCVGMPRMLNPYHQIPLLKTILKIPNPFFPRAKKKQFCFAVSPKYTSFFFGGAKKKRKQKCHFVQNGVFFDFFCCVPKKKSWYRYTKISSKSQSFFFEVFFRILVLIANFFLNPILGLLGLRVPCLPVWVSLYE